jgi:hypothetical protein
MAKRIRISRRDKKKLRAIFLCHTGNPQLRKSKYSKEQWEYQKRNYSVWMDVFRFEERRIANKVK